MLTFYDNVRDIEQSRPELAILPVGALEQHGSHLPVGTDLIIAEELATRLAHCLQAYLLPVLGISSSIEHRRAVGTVYMKADTLALVIRDIAESLQFSGFRRLIIVNGHGGNWIIKPVIRQLNRDFMDRQQEMDVILIPSSIMLPRQHEVTDHVKGDIHAGEKETSLMLHICKEHVRRPVSQPELAPIPQDFMDYFDVIELSEDGYWGYPENATAEKGERLVQLFVECAVDYLQQIDRMHESVKQRNRL